jgi:hypothetical protein
VISDLKGENEELNVFLQLKPRGDFNLVR